ncbi:MAG: hypothetical protein KGY80_10205 [Candidatus Thorarchaeota archaeon]|nr:hypothetical protein [Candidatus Thorarchaeota archaeon]
MLQPVGQWDEADLKHLKKLCDSQYSSPSILYEELATSEIHSIFIINVDDIKALEVDSHKYRNTVIQAERVVQMEQL